MVPPSLFCVGREYYCKEISGLGKLFIVRLSFFIHKLLFAYQLYPIWRVCETGQFLTIILALIKTFERKIHFLFFFFIETETIIDRKKKKF